MPVDRFCTFTDTPRQLDDSGGRARSRIQVAELGEYTDPRYGEFEITPEAVANWRTLLDTQFHGELPIDEDHKTDKGISSEASGWIVGLDQNGPDGVTPTPDQAWATVEWTAKGEQAVRDRRYRYISPTFVEDFEDARGKKHGPALLRAALTNNPFLRDMAPVSLSAATPDTDGQTARRVVPNAKSGGADSRAAMELTAIATALGLPVEADEKKILEAIGQTRKAAEKAAKRAVDPKTLEDHAKQAGLILLSEKAVKKLQAAAAEGSEAAKALREQRFDNAYHNALKDGRVDAKPETRELHHAFYTNDPDNAIRLLDSLPVIAPTRPAGYGAHQTPGGVEDAPANVDRDRHDLHEQITAYMAENKVDYVKALESIAGVSV